MIRDGDRWAERNNTTTIVTVRSLEESTGMVSIASEAGKQSVVHRDDFYVKYIRLDLPQPKKKKPAKSEEKKTAPSTIDPKALIPVSKETINADEIRDQLTPKQQAAMDKHLSKKPSKKFTPKDKTPFLVELQQEVVPRLQSFESALQEMAQKASTPVRILSFDPGISNIAICFIDQENKQHLTSKICIPEELTSTSVRLRYIEHVVEQWVRFFRPDVIFKEGVAHLAHNGVSDAGKLQYAIERVAMDYQIPYLTIPTMRMRSFLGAAGREHNKSDVKLEVFKKFNAQFNSEDECEAFAIGQTGIALIEKTWNPEAHTTKKSKAAKKK